VPVIVLSFHVWIFLVFFHLCLSFKHDLYP